MLPQVPCKRTGSTVVSVMGLKFRGGAGLNYYTKDLNSLIQSSMRCVNDVSLPVGVIDRQVSAH